MVTTVIIHVHTCDETDFRDIGVVKDVTVTFSTNGKQYILRRVYVSTHRE